MLRCLSCLILSLALAACGAPRSTLQSAPVGGADRAPVLALGPEPTEAPQWAIPARPAARTATPLPSSTPAARTATAIGGAYPAPATVTPSRTSTTGPGTPTVRPATATLASSGGGSSSSGGNGAATQRPVPTSTPRPRAPTAVPSPTEDRRPITLLRRGGLVIYLRHAHTDWSQNDRELEWVKEVLADGDDDLFEDCDRQRLLSDEGRDEARRIGEAVRGLGIPVGEVLTSPWCRTRETAELAFGGGEVAEGRLFDTGYLPSGSGERKEFRDKLRELLSDAPGEGSNRVIVGHMPQLQDAAGVSLSEGEAAIIQPGDGDFKVITRVSAGDWARLGP